MDSDRELPSSLKIDYPVSKPHTLKSAPPDFLTFEGEDAEVCRFFLMLSHVHNELWGILHWSEVHKSLDISKFKGVNEWMGLAGGVTLQLKRLVYSIISELLDFLNKNFDKIAEHHEYKRSFKELSATYKNYWIQLIDISKEKEPSKTKFSTALYQIRSNITFHYHEPKRLAQGYKKFFNTDQEASSAAFYSLGKLPETTRFFFADAAAEGVVAICIPDELKSTFDTDVEAVIRKLLVTSRFLIENFIQIRKSGLRRSSKAGSSC